jgi:poly(3-hydroxybutyrate) depolymerase
MSLSQVRRAAVTVLCCVAAVAGCNRGTRSGPNPAQVPATGLMEEAAPPGANYDKAEFRFWSPRSAQTVRAVLVLVPGSNGDGRPAAEDAEWQAYATKNKLAIVACRFTDKPHDQSFIEHYANVSQGSGQALLDAITKFAARSKHPEIARAPLLLWGMSAGGEFNYEFTVWKPERVAAFIVNKGNFYYTALVPPAAREVPGMLFVGGKDLEFRTNTIVGLFAVNRRGGALWALAEEPGVGHVVGKSRDVAMVFFEDVLEIRLADGAAGLKPMPAKPAFLGDLKTKSFQPAGETAPPGPTAWLPTERVARAWLDMVKN